MTGKPTLAEALELHAGWLNVLVKRYADYAGLDRDDFRGELVLHVAQTWDTFDPKVCAPTTWLGNAARWHAARLREREGRRVKALNLDPRRDPSGETPLTEHPDPGPPVDEAAWAAEVVRRVRRAVAALPELQREAIRLRLASEPRPADAPTRNRLCRAEAAAIEALRLRLADLGAA